MHLQEAKPFKTWEILPTLCLRSRATAQSSASRTQMWRWSVTKHSSQQSDINLTSINTEKRFSLVLQPAGFFFCWRQSQANTCLLFWVRSPIRRSLLSAVNKSLQDKAPASCSRQQPTICGVKKVQVAHKNWEKQQSRFSWHQNVPGSLCCFTRLLPAAQKNLPPAFFNALCWTFNANLYSCQLLFFSHFPAKRHWPTWNVFLTYRDLSWQQK